MKELLINLINVAGFAWWVEIITASPRCTYYFGPFLTAKEAEEAQDGYLDDLEEEGALGIRVEIKRCKPTELTIYDDLGKMGELGVWATFSGLP